jgi:hypothetical protein
MSNTSIDSLQHEERRFPPSAEFRADAVATAALYAEAAEGRLAFWATQARELLHWNTPFAKDLDWSNAPFATWFEDGELNVAYNCLDRHVLAGNGDRIALHWEGEPGDSRDISYSELTAEVKRAANLLTSLGIEKGDRVAVYLPMIPEAVIAMLAVARIGAVHSVIFGGFSADSIRSRVDDASAKLVITADGGWRKGRVSALKPAVDAALAKEGEHTVSNVLVVKRGEKRRCSSFTPPAPPASRRASCTPAGATSPRPPSPTGTCSTSARSRTSTGAPQTSAGSPATAMSSTARSPTVQPRCSTRARPIRRTVAGGGRSSRSTV